MKEIREIIKSYLAAQAAGKRAALATVVRVEGSSYRRPGARMLITEDGLLTGAISGGCLEGDALRKALSAIHSQENRLVAYDSRDEDDTSFGVQLGCNGLVHILFEPIDPSNPLNPIELLKLVELYRQPTILVCIFSMTQPLQKGTVLLMNKYCTKSVLSETEELISYATTALKNKKPDFKTVLLHDMLHEVFIDFISPSLSVIIVGAGNDVQPLAEIGAVLGWRITIADGRPSHANPQRFPKADEIIVSSSQNLPEKLNIDEYTAVLLMTHNYNYDLSMLDQLLGTDTSYIGVLGPKTKLERMFKVLRPDSNFIPGSVHGPIGLDIGAETAEQIAISIAAEIQAVFSGRKGQSLRIKPESIHAFSTPGD